MSFLNLISASVIFVIGELNTMLFYKLVENVHKCINIVNLRGIRGQIELDAVHDADDADCGGEGSRSRCHEEHAFELITSEADGFHEARHVGESQCVLRSSISKHLILDL